MPLPRLPENHIWGVPRVEILKGDLFKEPREVEAEVTLVIKYKPKWYIPAKKVRTARVVLPENTSEMERVKRILQKAEELVFSYQLDSHGKS